MVEIWMKTTIAASCRLFLLFTPEIRQIVLPCNRVRSHRNFTVDSLVQQLSKMHQTSLNFTISCLQPCEGANILLSLCLYAPITSPPPPPQPLSPLFVCFHASFIVFLFFFGGGARFFVVFFEGGWGSLEYVRQVPVRL